MQEITTKNPNIIMPYNAEVEQAVLAALMHDNNLHDQIGDFLKSEHFFDPLHQAIYMKMQQLIQSQQLANPITLANHLSDHEGLQRSGGARYLAQIAGFVLSLSGVREYGKQIYDLALRREIIKISDQAIDTAGKVAHGVSAMDQISKIEHALFKVSQSDARQEALQHFSGILSSAIDMAEIACKNKGEVIGVPTGLIDVDRTLGGMHKTDLIVVAGRPAMGKSALGTTIAFNAALKQKKVAFFSIEMSPEQLAMRVLSSETGISSDQIRRGVISTTHFAKFAEVSQKLYDTPLYIDDTAMLTTEQIRNRARRLCRKQGLDLIIIDYIQLISTSGKVENRVQQVSEISRSLKTIAKELNVPIIAISQLSRSVEHREDKRPQLSDLRESGSIEQDADVVMFIYRDEYYLNQKKPGEDSPEFRNWQDKMQNVHGVADLIISKNRHGPTDVIKLHFDARRTRFENYVPQSAIDRDA